jgi:hypothetical protein
MERANAKITMNVFSKSLLENNLLATCSLDADFQVRQSTSLHPKLHGRMRHFHALHQSCMQDLEACRAVTTLSVACRPGATKAG